MLLEIVPVWKLTTTLAPTWRDVVAMTHARESLMSMGNEWDRYTRLNDDKAQGVLRKYNLMLINIRKGFIIAILSVRAMALTLFLHWHFVLYFMQKNAKITAVGNMEHFCGVINL